MRSLVLIALFLPIWGLNTWAFSIYVPTAEFWDWAYGGLQLFVISLQKVPPDSNAIQAIPWQLGVMRFIAPIFTVFALVYGLAGAALEYIPAIAKRLKGRRNIVIVGYGRVGRALLEALRERDPKARIVCLDREITVADKNLVGKHGGRLYQVDAFDRETRRSLLVGLNRIPDERHEIYVACGSDEETLAVVSDIEDERRSLSAPLCARPAHHIYFHLRSPQFAEKLRNTPGYRSEPFELARYSVEDILDRFALPVLARALFQARVHVVVHGYGDSAIMAMEEVLLTGQMPPPTYLRPRISVICEDHEQARARWEAKHFGAAEHFDVHFHELPVDGAPSPNAHEASYAASEADLPVTMHLVTFEDDRRALGYALSLREMMRRGLRQSAPIATLAGAATSQISGLADASEVAQLRFEVGGDSAAAAKRSFICTTEIEELARRIHAGYMEIEPSAAQYDELAYTLKLSNRRAAVHMLTKLRLMGFEDLNPYKPGFQLSLKARHYLRDLLKNDKRMAELETFEHVRWRVDRLLEGWRNGPRDEDAMFREQLGDISISKLTHQKVEEFREQRLSRDDQKKDAAQFASLSRYLEASRVPHAHSRPVRRILTRSWDGDPPRWVMDGSKLSLELERAPQDWRQWADCAQDEELRVQMLLPPAPPLEGVKHEAGNDVLIAAYCAFAEGLAKQGIRVRLARADKRVWNWLPSNRLDPRLAPLIEGVTLPRLVIGVCGHRQVERLGDVELVEDTLVSLFDRLHVPGFTKLIVGGAPGFDDIALRAFHRSAAGQAGAESELLFPYSVEGKPAWNDDPSAIIASRQMRLARIRTPIPIIPADAVDIETPHTKLADTLLDRCNYLVVMSDGVSGGPGGTVDTIEKSQARHMLIRRIEAPLIGPLPD